MIRELFLSDFPLSSCVWQSTIFLVVGLVSSFILRHRSSRAHQVLFLAMIAAVIVPIMSILVKHYELGLFVAEPVVMQSQAEDWAITSNYGASDIISAEDIEHKPGSIERHLPPATAGSESAKLPWRSLVLGGWIAASLILAARLLLTFALGVRLLGRALPLQCEKIKEAAHLAKAKLGIDKDVMVHSSRGVRSPVIWCWRRRPVLLVPSAAGRSDNGVDWAGVLCHELAHYKRRDHISGLLAELVACILPWHPLLWWAKSRLVRLSEQACDDWVVATGQPCTDYAESLLDLTPGGQMAFVPAVVSSKRGLAGRIHRILKDSCGNPRTGATWALGVSVVAVCLAVGVAFAQTRPAKQETTTKHDAKYTKSLHEAVADGDIEQVKSALSTEKLKQLGLAVAMYADDHDKKLPDSLEALKPYIASEKIYFWILDNVEYLGKNKNYQPNQPKIPVAYDKTQIDEQSGTDVLFLDGHVEFVPLAKLKELLEVEKRFKSAKKLSRLGTALCNYADDYEDRFPDSMQKLQGYPYLNEEEFEWALANVKYLAKGRMLADPPDVILAYDKKILTEGMGTNILRNDTYVGFVKFEELKKLGIGATEILIDTRLLSVSEDFLKDVGLNANSISTSGAWSEHLAAKYPAEPNSETFSLIIDALHVRFLLKTVQDHHDSKALVAPQVLCQEGKTAEIAVLTEEYYVIGYNEPNSPSEKPQQKIDKVEIGTRIWLKPELTPDNENVRLDFKLEIRQLLGYEERKYKGKYKYIVPRTEVVSTQKQLVVPDGKTLLIGGLKIIEQVTKEPSTFIGGLFKRGTIKNHKMLLILVKPIINPQQKARKILPGEADSEEHIKSLARQLEKKLKRHDKPK